MENLKDLEQFIESWNKTGGKTKEVFVAFRDLLLQKKDVLLAFKHRPGISFSLRAKKEGQKRDLFVVIDVIDEDVENRWLSVCFYKDTVTDPGGLGDLIPGGLLGEDGYCFDIEPDEKEVVEYVAERIEEAYRNAV